MAASLNSEVADNVRGPTSTECVALLDAATPDLYRKNAFRVTGLPTDATAREISKQLEKQKILQELGRAGGTHGGVFPLKPLPSVQDIRNADQRLRDPEQRIIDEFFWFWSTNQDDSEPDPALHALAGGDTATAERIWMILESHPAKGAAAAHNLAVRWHLTALDLETPINERGLDPAQLQNLEQYWRQALKRWGRIAADHTIWKAISGRIRRIDDPRLALGFARGMQATLPRALAKINAALAMTYSDNGEKKLAEMHIRLMRDATLLCIDQDEVVALIVAPAARRLREQSRLAQQQATASPETGSTVVLKLMECADRYDDLVRLIRVSRDKQQRGMLDEMAAACVACLVAYQRKTENNRTFVDLLKVTLTFPVSEPTKRRIEENIQIGLSNLLGERIQPIYGALAETGKSSADPKARLEAIQRDVFPKLAAVKADLELSQEMRSKLYDEVASVLRVISIDAWNTKQDATTANAAVKLAMQYACGAKLKAQVHEDFSTLDLADKQRKQRNIDRLKLVVWGVVPLFVILSATGVFDPPKNASISPPQAPAAPSNSGGNGSVTAPAIESAPDSSSSQITYREPSSMTADFDRDSQTIEVEKAKARQLEEKLGSVKHVLDSKRAKYDALNARAQALSNQIENNRNTVDATNSGAVDEFNRQVSEYDAIVRRARNETVAANDMVRPYNDLVDAVHAQEQVVDQLVVAYNAKVRRYEH
jgi:hypothetical protein